MSTPTFVILVLCFASIAAADDFRTINGKDYKNATVNRVEPDTSVMNDWNLLVILAAIGLSWFFLRKYIEAKSKNLAQKEYLRHLTDIVEGVRARFERANLVHRVQFEAEF